LRRRNAPETCSIRSSISTSRRTAFRGSTRITDRSNLGLICGARYAVASTPGEETWVVAIRILQGSPWGAKGGDQRPEFTTSHRWTPDCYGSCRHCKAMKGPARKTKRNTTWPKRRGVVCLVRTPACHAGGQEFESRCPRQFPSLGPSAPLESGCRYPLRWPLYTRLIFPSRFSEQNRDARMQAFECLEELVHSCGFASHFVSLQVGRYC
jgi:hypothetical protein